MNRPLTEVFSPRGNGNNSNHANASCNVNTNSSYTNTIWQSETSHRYVLGVYELQARLLQQFPYILLENSASGGGRFDAGMLYYSTQIWCSDNTDAIARLKIQYGTSIIYPVSCVGTHITAVPNHITGGE